MEPHHAAPLLLIVLLGAALIIPPPADAAEGDVVYLLNIDGIITRGTRIAINDAIQTAERAGAPLVLQVDTPGGLVDATLDIYRNIVRAEVPVMVFVGPRGGFAASAGTLILLMGHPNGMAPGTQIGSAQPINVGPDGQSQPAGDKVENFLVERIREIAERTGRNTTLAERFITENLNMNATQALDTGMVDVLAPDVRTFIKMIHGQQAIVGDTTVTLDTQDARVVVLKPGALSRIVDILGNPQIAFIFFIAGLYALVFGLANPGSYVPETIGALLLLLGLIGLGLFSANTAGVLLLLLGAILLIAEVFTPTSGVLTVTGVIAIILSAFFLIDEPLLPGSFMRQFYIVGIALALLSGGAVFAAVTLALRTRNKPIYQDLVGREAVALEELQAGQTGQVSLRGETWNARLREGEPIPQGGIVRVTGRDGLLLVVEHPQPQNMDASPEKA